MKARGVTIHSLSVRPELVEGPSFSVNVEKKSGPSTSSGRAGEGAVMLETITLTAHVSKGTYIRSLARAIAHAGGSVGHVTTPRRTQAAPFALAQAISLSIARAWCRERVGLYGYISVDAESVKKKKN